MEILALIRMNVDILDLGPDRIVAIGSDVLRGCPKFFFTKRMANLNLNNLLDLRLMRIDRFGDWGIWVSVFQKKRFMKLYNKTLFDELSLFLDEIYNRRVEGSIGIVKHANEIRLNIPSTIKIAPTESLEGVLDIARDKMVDWTTRFINQMCKSNNP